MLGNKRKKGILLLALGQIILWSSIVFQHFNHGAAKAPDFAIGLGVGAGIGLMIVALAARLRCR